MGGVTITMTQATLFGFVLLSLMAIAIALVALMHVRRFHDDMDYRIDQADNRGRETLARIDTIDKSLGDLDISANREIQSVKTKLDAYKKEQNGRCDKMTRRIETLEDISGNLESVGVVADDLRAISNRVKELYALQEANTKDVHAVTELAKANMEIIQQLRELAENLVD